MSGNEKRVRCAVASLQPGMVEPEAVLGLLDLCCRKLGTQRTKNAALSALLIFKLGRYLFPERASFQAYLGNAFQVYSPDILRCNPALAGILHLSAAYDRTPFDKRTETRLCELVNDLARLSVKSRRDASEYRAATEEEIARDSWAGALGDLSNDWFERDPGSEQLAEGLADLPHFVHCRQRPRPAARTS